MNDYVNIIMNAGLLLFVMWAVWFPGRKPLSTDEPPMAYRVTEAEDVTGEYDD